MKVNDFKKVTMVIYKDKEIFMDSKDIELSENDLSIPIALLPTYYVLTEDQLEELLNFKLKGKEIEPGVFQC